MRLLFLIGLMGPMGLINGAANQPPPPAAVPQPVVPAVQADVQPEIDKHIPEALKKTMERLAMGNDFPAHLKTPVRLKSIADPWGALADLEGQGLGIAKTADQGVAAIPALLDQLSAALGKPKAANGAFQLPKPTSLRDHINAIIRTLDQAKQLRDEAMRGIKADDLKFMFRWPEQMVEVFGPQLSLDAKTKSFLNNDRTFCMHMEKQCDWAKLAAAAKLIADLGAPAFTTGFQAALEKESPTKEIIEGVSGDILFKVHTPHGLIICGGRGKNTYELKEPVAAIVDLGGDDEYRGLVASSQDAEHPFGIIIDLAGNDRYEGKACGVATGRLGVGFLLDLAGEDRYALRSGAGGTGFGGIGILCDLAGNDIYTGSRCTQGAAIGGVGLLLDLDGDDTHTSFGLAIGMGGPLGVGAVIDNKGNDSYQCGKKYPSGYNQSDAPNAKPDEPNFQWDCFGMAMGLGRRLYPPGPEANGFNLAGGVGMIIDARGDDRYDSSNFSQACGYFFGVGLKLDLAGDDVHGAARYGHASGAHYGMGLFIDYAGNDKYPSTGPTYNGGCSWDRSVFLFVDGAGDDAYSLERTSGPGRGDHGGWGVFADLAGADRYPGGSGFGTGSTDGVSAFFDKAGEDEYPTGGDPKPANRSTHKNGDAGVFIDK